MPAPENVPLILPRRDVIRPWVVAAVSIVSLSFIANFLLLRHFGLYEDDYIWVMTLFPLNWSAAEFKFYLADIWHHWIVYQGRPLGFSADIILAYFGRNFASLGPSYAIGYLIQSANALTLLALLWRAFGRRFAVVATIAFLAFPADTSRQLLMHRLLHLSESFLLIALLLYQRGYRIAAYAVVCLTLATYESCYLPFLFAPFIVKRTLPSLRHIIGHILVFFAAAAALLLVRSAQGDDRSRLVTQGLGGSFSHMILACLIGLWSALTNALSAAAQAFAALGLSDLGLVALVVGLLALPLCWRVTGQPEPNAEDRSKGFLRLVIFALATAFTYVLAFRAEYFPPTTTIGRLSGLNMAAAIPFGLMIGTLDQLTVPSAGRMRRLSSAVVPAFLVLWVMYGVHIQRTEYATNWEAQQKPFWTEVMAHSGQFADGVPILVEMDAFPRTRGFHPLGFVGGKAFAALDQFVAFPSEWKSKPGVYGVTTTTTVSLEGVDHVLHAPEWNKGAWPVLRDNGFFLIKYEQGRFVFSSESILLSGVRFQPRTLQGNVPPRRLTAAGRIVFGQSP